MFKVALDVLALLMAAGEQKFLQGIGVYVSENSARTSFCATTESDLIYVF